jgi:tetratricopeptide (TPR) repeat protein
VSRKEQDHKYLDLIADCDLMIKSGKVNQVIGIISELVISQVPRSARQGLAKCCRRIGLIGHGLRLLHPIVRSATGLDETVTADEACEYSALLARNGSVHEALELLKSVDAVAAPEALLYQGQCHILNWEYSDAVEFFNLFLGSSDDEYSKLIARVNLISGYIVLFRLQEAIEVLKETIELAQKAGAMRLLANCYELWGQIYFWQNDYPSARLMLEKAFEIFNNAQSFDQLLILKTESIMKSLEENTLAPLTQFRKLALQRKNWESVREADLFILKMAPNQRQLDHLFFGTPRIAYRRRIKELIGAPPSQTYVIGSENGPQLDLQTGLGMGIESLPFGGKIHQVISALNRDFYAPITLDTLFYDLYPNEYFDVESSPFRIRQAILRTRQWLENNKIPASITQSQGAYRFLITGEFGIRIQLEHLAVNPMMARWQQLKENLAPGIHFTSEHVCEEMGWSRTTFRRLADWACEKDLLKKSGTGKATTYQITSKKLLGAQKKVL